jgi:hypothetical protein
LAAAVVVHQLQLQTVKQEVRVAALMDKIAVRLQVDLLLLVKVLQEVLMERLHLIRAAAVAVRVLQVEQGQEALEAVVVQAHQVVFLVRL